MRRKNGMQIRIPQAKFAQIRDLMDTAERHAKEDGYDGEAGIILDKRFYERYKDEMERISMRILVATKKTQGQRPNDFCFVPEGEPVTFSFECDTDKDPDGACGCRRSMSGTQCHKGTTTMEVQIRHMSLVEYKAMIYDHLIKGGWYYGKPKDADAHVKSDAMELLRIAGQFLPGTVLEKRGNVFQERKPIVHGTIVNRMA